MEENAPHHFICPISLDVMRKPILVEHNGTPYWFEESYLNAHNQSPHGDRNPLTNEDGFRGANRMLDKQLQDEIQKSKWAPKGKEQVPVLEPETDDDVDVVGTIVFEQGPAFLTLLPPSIAATLLSGTPREIELPSIVDLVNPAYNNENVRVSNIALYFQ